MGRGPAFEDGAGRIVANPAGTELYVLNWGGNTISVISAATNEVTATITGITSPYAMAFDPTRQVAYVVGDGTVTTIDTTANTVSGTFTGYQNLAGVAVEPNHTVLVCDYDTDTLYQLNPGTGAVLARYPTGANPYGPASHLSILGTGTVYVTDRGSNAVTGLVFGLIGAPRTVTIPVGTGPSKVAFSPNGQHAYVVNLGGGTVSIINVYTNTVIATAGAGLDGPDNVATYWRGVVWITNYHGNDLTEIDSQTGAVTATIAVGNEPAGVALAG